MLSGRVHISRTAFKTHSSKRDQLRRFAERIETNDIQPCRWSLLVAIQNVAIRSASHFRGFQSDHPTTIPQMLLRAIRLPSPAYFDFDITLTCPPMVTSSYIHCATESARATFRVLSRSEHISKKENKYKRGCGGGTICKENTTCDKTYGGRIQREQKTILHSPGKNRTCEIILATMNAPLNFSGGNRHPKSMKGLPNMERLY